jgi:Putative zinc- or iron-chelating domain
MGEAKRKSASRDGLRRLVARSPAPPIAKLVIPSGPGLPSRERAVETAAIAEAVRTRVRAALVRASQAGTLAHMFEAIAAIGAQSIAEFEAALATASRGDGTHQAEMAAIACRRGCAFCCHVNVDVTPLEAIRLARRVLSERRSLGAAEEAPARRPPCLLLSQGACTVYDIRPFACRAVFSPDAARCEAGFVSDAAVAVPSLDWPRFIASGYLTGEIAAMDDLGLASHMVELRRALPLLIADEGAAMRWLNGEDALPRRAGAMARDPKMP